MCIIFLQSCSNERHTLSVVVGNKVKNARITKSITRPLLVFHLTVRHYSFVLLKKFNGVNNIASSFRLCCLVFQPATLCCAFIFNPPIRYAMTLSEALQKSSYPHKLPLQQIVTRFVSPRFIPNFIHVSSIYFHTNP